MLVSFLLVHDGNYTEAKAALSDPANCFAGFGGTAGLEALEVDETSVSV